MINNGVFSVRFSTHQEPSFVYHNIPNNSGLLEINGFFQSWKYLEGVENEVIDELSFSKENLDSVFCKKPKTDYDES